MGVFWWILFLLVSFLANNSETVANEDTEKKTSTMTTENPRKESVRSTTNSTINSASTSITPSTINSASTSITPSTINSASTSITPSTINSASASTTKGNITNAISTGNPINNTTPLNIGTSLTAVEVALYLIAVALFAQLFRSFLKGTKRTWGNGYGTASYQVNQPVSLRHEGTGAFRNHLCPHLRVANKGSSNVPCTTTCGRPHCKYNHNTQTILEEKQNGVSLPTSNVNKRSAVSESSSFVVKQSSTDYVSSCPKSMSAEKKEPNAEESVASSSCSLEILSSSSYSVLSLLPDLKEVAETANDVVSTTIPPVFNEEIIPARPTYSDAPSVDPNNVDDNPYANVWNDLTKTTQSNDLEYDPVSNWKLPFQSTVETPPSTLKVETTLLPTSSDSTESSTGSASGSAALRNRLAADSESVVALGRKYSGKNALPNTSTLTKAQQLAAAVPSSSQQSARKKHPVHSSGSEISKPVKKKARFGKSPDEDSQEIELVETPRRKKVLDTAEVMRNLFGDDDEDGVDDSDIQLPIEMSTKPPTKAVSVPKGFPKNQQNLLQSLTAKAEDAKPLPKLVHSQSAPITKRKLVLNPQQQLELRRKALEEQKKQLQQSRLTGSSPTVAPIRSIPVATINEGKRIAHQPTASVSAPPRVAVISGSKLNVPFRQQVLERFVQYLKLIHKNESEAIEKALQTEKDIATTSFHMGTYRNKATHELSRLKQAAAPPTPIQVSPAHKDSPINFPKVQTSPMQTQKSNFSVVPKNSQQRAIFSDPKTWNEQDFHNAMRKFVLTEDHLVINGYPLIQTKKQDGENTRNGLQLYIAMSGKITPDRITQTRRNCCRCKKDFTVDFEGNYAREEDCIYHWGKAFSRRVAGEGMSARRNCCSSEDSIGCSVAPAHVTDTIPSLSGFVSTSGIQSTKPEDRYRVYAIDCEMIYTVGGMEVARVTVVDRSLRCVYESLIQPKQRIIDCNTRFSGLKMDQFGRDKQLKTIEDIHKDLIGPLINEDTILIGHSLESDLLALKLIHRNIVDTSIVFPHKRGPPFKRALRNLMREILQRIIQEDAGGHDSREDAAACMELMTWKIRQDRERNPRL